MQQASARSAKAAAAAAEERKALAERFKKLPKHAQWLKSSDLEDHQRAGLLAMAEKFPSYKFTEPITRETFLKMQRDPSYGWADKKISRMFRKSGWVLSEVMERGRGSNGAPLDGLSDLEMVALDKAFYTQLLGFPLIMWDRRIGLKPSPLRRIYQCLYHIAPEHQLKKIKLKELYDDAKRQLSCNDMYRDSDFEQRKKWNDEMVRVLNEKVKALETKVSHRLRSALAWLDSRGGALFRERPGSVGSAEDLARRGRHSTLAGSKEHLARMEKLLFTRRKETERQQIIKEREARKLKLEKRLQSLTEANIIRSVESPESHYQIGAPPFDLYARDILEYVVITTDLGKGTRVFREFILRPVSMDLYADCFWYLFCKNFQHRAEQEVEYLRQRIATKYVRIVGKLNDNRGQFPSCDQLFFMTFNKDIVFKILPFALARAVILGFTFLCPASRHLYTNQLMESVYDDLYSHLFGVNVCGSSVRISRNRFFDEAADHPGNPGAGNQSEADSAGDSNNASERLPTLQQHDGSSRSSSPLGGAKDSAASSRPRKNSDGFVYVKTTRRARRLRQWRERFGANMISPMVQEYLGTAADRRVSSCFARRTTCDLRVFVVQMSCRVVLCVVSALSLSCFALVLPCRNL